MKTRKIIKELCYNSIIAALYVTLVFVLGFMSYGPIQVRFAEVLIFIVLINKKYTLGITLGCFIANLVGPYGVLDACIGSIATFLCCFLLSIFNKPWLGIILLPVCNIIVGLEISILANYTLIPTIVTILWVMLGELISAITGFVIYLFISKNKKITEFLS